MKRLMAFFLFAAVAVSAQVLVYESHSRVAHIVAGTAVTSTPWHVGGGAFHIQLDDDDADAYVHWSPDYLVDGDFEDDPRSSQGSMGTSNIGSPVSPWSDDLWDDNGALTGRWSQTEGAGGSIEVTSTEIFGEESLLYDASGGTAVVEIGTNMAIDTNLTGWTTAVGGGSGTTAFSATDPHTAGKVIITGGSAHVDFTQAVTVVADTEYFVTFWWQEGASDDLCDFRIQESTGGTDYLLTSSVAGTWQAGAADVVTTDGDSSSAYEQGFVQFTTQTGVTGITLWFAADVTADVCDVDDVSMALVPATEIQSATLFQVTDTASNSYIVGVWHTDGGTDSRFQISLQDAATCTGDNTCLYWDGSSDWTTTETWVTCTNVGTTATVCEELFLAHDAALATSDHRVIVKFRALMGTSEDITIDSVYLIETAIAGRKGMPLYGANTVGHLGPVNLDIPELRGRFSVIASGAVTASIFGTQYGGE